MRDFARPFAAVALALLAQLAHATFHTYRIEQLYTNADGTVQFVVLHESSDSDGENLWSGHTLRTTGGPAGAQQIAFPTDLPSSRTAGTRVLVATPGFAALGIVAPDYTMPANFLPIGGGTINFAGVDQVPFGPLPTDGVQAISRTGVVVRNVATNFAGVSGSVAAGPPVVVVVEYYNAALDHYFVTHIAGEIAILDAGVTIKGWTRTGQSFAVYAAAGAGTSPVCRYYIPPGLGNSHFYGRGTVECEATGQKNPSFVNEEPQFFHVVLPDAGTCAVGLVAVYRVFSNRADANHRYMVDRTLRDQMVTDRHWLAEGDGSDLVVMCVPPMPVAAVPLPSPVPPEEEPGEPGYGYPP
ncbi:MAG: hypothetical protein U1F58_02595 [Burkholderiales bacterium]